MKEGIIMSKKIMYLALAVLMLSFVISYIEIVWKNATPNPKYDDKNIIVNLVEKVAH